MQCVMTSFTCSLNAWTEEVIELLMQLVWRHARPHPPQCPCRCGVRAASCACMRHACQAGQRWSLSAAQHPLPPQSTLPRPCSWQWRPTMPVRSDSDP
jgi:hypothetical protein